MFDSGSCQVEYTGTENVGYVSCRCHAVMLETHYGFTVTAVIRRSEEELFEFTRRSVLYFGSWNYTVGRTEIPVRLHVHFLASVTVHSGVLK